MTVIALVMPPLRHAPDWQCDYNVLNHAMRWELVATSDLIMKQSLAANIVLVDW